MDDYGQHEVRMDVSPAEYDTIHCLSLKALAGSRNRSLAGEHAAVQPGDARCHDSQVRRTESEKPKRRENKVISTNGQRPATQAQLRHWGRGVEFTGKSSYQITPCEPRLCGTCGGLLRGVATFSATFISEITPFSRVSCRPRALWPHRVAPRPLQLAP